MAEKNTSGAVFRERFQARCGTMSDTLPELTSMNRRLMWHGMLLFLLGLLTGFAEPQFANVRMGLAAHLEGVMNGIFLLALGACWTHLVFGPRATKVAFWLALYGTYMNWVFTTLAAVLGTGALSPITAPGRHALPWQEALVMNGFKTVGLAIVAFAVMALWGLRAKAAVAESARSAAA
jgi:hydroxylaminobenzene mutase